MRQPPPVHQQFEPKAFVVGAFVPRLFGYHPRAIPAPYYHSNIGSDELLCYVDGTFTSRNTTEQKYLTLHRGHSAPPGARRLRAQQR